MTALVLKNKWRLKMNQEDKNMHTGARSSKNWTQLILVVFTLLNFIILLFIASKCVVEIKSPFSEQVVLNTTYNCVSLDNSEDNFSITLNADGTTSSENFGMGLNNWERKANGDIYIQPDTEGKYSIEDSILFDNYGEKIAICSIR